jgi:hypothetical protein
LLLVFLHPFALEFFYYQVTPVILIAQTLPTLLSFLVPFVPSEFLNAHQQFFEAISFGVRSIVFVAKLLFLSQQFTFCATIPIF